MNKISIGFNGRRYIDKDNCKKKFVLDFQYGKSYESRYFLTKSGIVYREARFPHGWSDFVTKTRITKEEFELLNPKGIIERSITK